MNKYSTLVDLLRDRADREPDKILYKFLQNVEIESGSLTFRELDLFARAIAACLQSLQPPGSRVLVVYPHAAGLEFIAAFFGCLYAGVIAVTDNPPQNARALSKFQERVESSGATVLLSTRELLDKLKAHSAQNPELASKLKKLHWVATDTISSADASYWQEPQLKGDTLAFFQYTSGSTGNPKGVMVTHENMLQNSAIIHQCFGHSSDSRGLIWLPLFHDMGLIGGVIQPLYVGFPCTLMSPMALIQKPFHWLEAISKYRATTSGGPNFAYELVCRQTDSEQLSRLDLSCWEVAFSGAEPVLARTLEKFAEIFSPCGFRKEAFYPCYGMAEATLFISGGLKSEPPIIKYLDKAALEENRAVFVSSLQEGAKAIVGCGRAWSDNKIVIVDSESLNKCSDCQVGEIWLSGSGVGKGYWNRSIETAETFNAYTSDTREGPFLRTGDLGFLHEGELFITGRLKDVMILWGRYQYPHYIEQTVENSHPALRANCGAAFSVEVEGEERLVVVQELRRDCLKNLNAPEIIKAIAETIAREHLVEVYAVTLLETATIPKTSSGKIRRSDCKTKFLDGSLRALAEWRLSST